MTYFLHFLNLKMNSYLPENRQLTKIYYIREKLGEGGSGIVRLCVEKTTNTEFAVKTINKIKLMNQGKVRNWLLFLKVKFVS